jgi:hypothetical protein
MHWWVLVCRSVDRDSLAGVGWIGHNGQTGVG